MTGQDWLDKDFYATLGVSKDADEKEIKKAYRKKARTLHPDHNPGDAEAERKFKELSEAYAVISDAKEREQYDSFRAMAGGGPRFSAGRGGGAGFDDLFGGSYGRDGNVRYSSSSGGGGFEDILGGLFGGGRSGFGAQRGPQRGGDLAASTRLPFRQAVAGSTVTLAVDGKTMTVRIPPGVRDGQKIRLRGKGQPGSSGGPAGDLLVTVNVDPDPVFSIDGNNLLVTVPVTFAEASLGGQILVPTLDHKAVTVKVAPGTPNGRTLRVKGRGVVTSKGAGDLLATIEVVVPTNLSGDARAAVEAFAAATASADVRADLLAAANAAG